MSAWGWIGCAMDCSYKNPHHALEKFLPWNRIALLNLTVEAHANMPQGLTWKPLYSVYCRLTFWENIHQQAHLHGWGGGIGRERIEIWLSGTVEKEGLVAILMNICWTFLHW